MKLKLKKTPIKAKRPVVVKARKVKKVDAKAVDTLGMNYERLRLQISTVKDSYDSCSHSIKQLAEESGVKEGKQTIVYGNKYVVGYTVSERTPCLNEEKAAKLLTKAQLAKVQVTRIDANLVIRLVEDGKLTKDKFLQMVDFPPATKSVYVRTLAEHKKRSEGAE